MEKNGTRYFSGQYIHLTGLTDHMLQIMWQLYSLVDRMPGRPLALFNNYQMSA
jgi:hypothetical protein